MSTRHPTPLSAAHLAFVRSWAEGIDPLVAWNRYLLSEGAADTRRVRSQLERLLETLRGLSRVHGRPDLAALLQRDPEAMVDPPAPGLTLDAFAATQPADFYSEAELMALFAAAHPAGRRRDTARRRQRLRQRLVAAIDWLEGAAVRSPRPEDAVEAWIDSRVAARLAQVGIRSLAHLLFWIRQRGFHWHRRVPRLGPAGAVRLLRWLREHEATLGALPAAALAPRAQLDPARLAPAPSCGVVPLERFVLPEALNGRAGSNRAPASWCRLPGVDDDLQALQAWLDRHPAGSHTWRAYRKEGERFLLWAVLCRRKALSALDGQDCAGYAEFLSTPGPAWVGRRHVERWSPAWRPFEGPLSERSRASAVSAVRSLCAWLVKQRYLAFDPWQELPSEAVSAAARSLAGRALPEPALQEVLRLTQAALHRQPSPALHRFAFLVRFAAATGLRLSEIAAAQLAWLEAMPLAPDGSAWALRVPARGKHAGRVVVLSPDVEEALRRWLVVRGLPAAFEASAPATPLLCSLRTGQALSAGRVAEVLQSGLRRCAQALLPKDAALAETIREASTEWLRPLAAASGRVTLQPAASQPAPLHG